MTSALNRLNSIKSVADSRADYSKFVARKRRQGWTEKDVEEYSAQVKLIMGNDEAAAMSVYPDGVFASHQEIKEAAQDYWKRELEMME